MGSKMLVDATHAEETRVVVVRGNRIEEFDFESAARKQLKGNIYLAKVTRVEPSLQAAFVEYGGNRHGFLAFSEIHPDYYQIPVADRQALLREQEEDDAEEHEDDNDDDENTGNEPEPSGEAQAMQASEEPQLASEVVDAEEAEAGQPADDEASSEPDVQAQEAPAIGEVGVGVETVEEDAESQKVESIGAEDALEEVPRRQRRAPRRQYKIQEVIKRRQIILVQVVKEERGNKGAALTTYLSLAGRYCVLMPNTARGGGISRKITDAGDRRRLKEVARDVEVPQGMGVIVRTAGAQRTRPEIKRDFDYLMRLWENVRDLTLHSTAPALVYEEGSLIKRSIRDLYTKDVDEVFVEGEAAYREAKDFMKMLMPSHAKNVKLYKDTRPLFSKHQTETQLDALYSPTVTLPSGGYIVMNQTEALVSVDINSGKATREHNIEDTALKTNLEACDEIARQLRLRDLAGLVVIDFIDMEENRNNRAVERRLKDALKNDRARIQVGRISHFGLMEMSRQRLRPGLLEGSSRPCPHCEGRGIVRSISSCGLSVLRAIEEHLISRKAEHLTVKCTREVAFYVLNEKRDNLLTIEQNYGISVFIVPSDEVKGSQAVIERASDRVVAARKIQFVPVKLDAYVEDAEEEETEAEVEAEEESVDVQAESAAEPENGEEGSDSQRGRRRRRGRRGGRRGGRDREDEPRDKIAGEGDGNIDAPRQAAEADDSAGDDVVSPNEAEVGSAPDDSSEKEGSERGPARRRDRWGRNRNGRNRIGRPAAEGESNGHAHAESPAEIRAPQPERQPTPVIAIQEIIAQPVEPRKWQPPAATVTAAEVAKPKAGWWSKRG
ncbi:MAG: Rne/Rng family ribonuclease [Hyphomicrobiales bacterium]|nr:Rne/Rng family ribonuclease [Hyphomicrobiales bacterium]